MATKKAKAESKPKAEKKAEPKKAEKSKFEKFQSTKVVEAKLFEKGDEDGFMHVGGFVASQMDEKDTIPFICPNSGVEEERVIGRFKETYLIVDNGVKSLMSKEEFESCFSKK